MAPRIERVPDGEGGFRRRFLLLAEVSFRSEGDGKDYYSNDELKGLIEDWIDSALCDRDDSPSIRFHEVSPQIPKEH